MIYALCIGDIYYQEYLYKFITYHQCEYSIFSTQYSDNIQISILKSMFFFVSLPSPIHYAININLQ